MTVFSRNSNKYQEYTLRWKLLVIMPTSKTERFNDQEKAFPRRQRVGLW